MGEVHKLFVAVVHRQPMREIEEASAEENKGFRGCIHGRPGSRRQVLLLDLETIEEFDLVPGAVKENVVTRGFDVRGLREGQRLRMGEVLLEVTGSCHPCHRMDEIRPGLQEGLRGKRGMLCRVVKSGLVRRGDPIEVLDYMRVASGPIGT